MTSAHGLSGNLKKRHILLRYRNQQQTKGETQAVSGVKLKLEKYHILFAKFALKICVEPQKVVKNTRMAKL